jgi:glutathione synthase/RimK-type ligase-like ATP-grasp enzyme
MHLQFSVRLRQRNSHSVHDMVREALNRLGLEMGVIDLKETADGELVWLEVNPQGQFLFLEPLTKLNLADHFADYLVHAAPCARE